MTGDFGSLMIVSNRLPITFEGSGKTLTVKPSSGGLVSALEPFLKRNGGVWVGSAGSEPDKRIPRLLREESKAHAHRYEPVYLTEEENTKFYEGFSNEILWPLFHDLQTRCNFENEYWDFYVRVNEKFAEVVRRSTQAGELIWIHDYQLLQVASALRRKGVDSQLAFFLHIPFPSPDIFAKLPWRTQILEGLLEHDLIGVQTERDERNFIACLRSYMPHVRISRRDSTRIVHNGTRETVLSAFPISVDFGEFDQSARSEEVDQRTAEIKEQLRGKQMVLGVDRLDYTKGITERVKAFAALLQEHPEMRRRVSLIQVAVPSRENIPWYQHLKSEIEQLVTGVNGEYGEPGWVPINYLYRPISRTEMLSLYRAADVALVTPLKDGMNLIAKEYCATRVDGDGVLVLSEFAGAAMELHSGAILVNPYDHRGVADALHRALNMPAPEQRRNMLRLRAQVRRYDLNRWVDEFLTAARGAQNSSARHSE